MTSTSELHPSTQALLKLFQFTPLPPDVQTEINLVRNMCQELADFMAHELPNNPAVSRGLTRLWEAKNEFVAALVLEHS